MRPIAILLLCLASGNVFAEETLKTLKWKLDTTQDGLSHVWERACFSADGSSILAIEKGVDQQSAVKSVTLREISRAGKVVREQLLFADRLSKRSSPPIRPFTMAMSPVPEGMMLVATVDDDLQPSIVMLDENWDVVTVTPLAKLIANAILVNSVNHVDGTILLGTNGKEAVAAQLSLKGEVAWSRSYSREKRSSALTACCRSQDGSILYLFGHTGITNKFGVGPQDLWIIRATAEGQVIDEQFFPGRNPVAAGPFEDGNLAVLFDVKTDFNTENRLRIIDGTGKKLSESPIEMGSFFTIHRPSMHKYGKNRFLMAGDAKVVEYDSLGREIGRIGKNMVLPLRQPSLVVHGASFLVIGNYYEPNEPNMGTLYFVE